jgi:hypothetical protein
MRFTREELILKALLALEDAIQECRYRRPRRSFAIRFALAYLWANSRGDRRHFDELWNVLGSEHKPWSFGSADHALGWVYKGVGVERPENLPMEMWGRWSRERGRGGPH